MNKKARQYLGLLCAVLAYYAVHEGAHLMYALSTGIFRQINLLGLGIQIDVYRESMTDGQLTLFCLAGPVATILTAWILTGFAEKIVKIKSKVFRACMYYITLAMLFVDPAYLCAVYKLVGGGDMNGIALLMPEWAVQLVCGALLILHGILFRKWVLQKYKKSFEGSDGQ